MSFMMSWKSPPKALHSFSIPASIFHRLGKKILFNFPTRKLLPTPPKNSPTESKTHQQNNQYSRLGTELQHQASKVHVKKCQNSGNGRTRKKHRSKIQVGERETQYVVMVSRPNPQPLLTTIDFSQLPAGQLDKRPKNTTSWLNHRAARLGESLTQCLLTLTRLVLKVKAVNSG